jgi:hypothetical protein
VLRISGCASFTGGPGAWGDWLEDAGRSERAEFIHLQLDLAAAPWLLARCRNLAPAAK